MTKRQYTWDPVSDSILEEINSAGTVLASYTTEPARFGRLVSQHRDGQSAFFHFDALGSARAVTEASENVTDTFAYDAWGNEITALGATATPVRWGGEWGYHTEKDTRLVSARRRQYSPQVGAWLSQDPEDVIRAMHRYLYVLNQPTSLVDPSGLSHEVPPGSTGDIACGTPCPERHFWNQAMCNDCVSCTCLDVELYEGISNEQAQNWVPQLGNVQCNVVIRFGDCVPMFPGVSWTAAGAGRSQQRTIYICLANSLQGNLCRAVEILTHELVHAEDLCNSRRDPPVTAGTCQQSEGRAYSASCAARIAQQCIKPQLRARRIHDCQQAGIRASCNAALGHPCDYFPNIFGDLMDECQRP